MSAQGGRILEINYSSTLQCCLFLHDQVSLNVLVADLMLCVFQLSLVRYFKHFF